MGCACKSAPKYSEEARSGKIELADVDLTKEKDSLVRFEKSFPIYKMHVSAWVSRLNGIGKSEVEIDYLKNVFNS